MLQLIGKRHEHMHVCLRYMQMNLKEKSWWASRPIFNIGEKLFLSTFNRRLHCNIILLIKLLYVVLPHFYCPLRYFKGRFGAMLTFAFDSKIVKNSQKK